MKIFLNGILLVEGKEDSSYLSNYIASEIIVVNGYEIPSHVIDYLKDKTVIALLDPDEAGLNIRKRIKTVLPNAFHIEIDINKCSRGIKNGVAECEIEEILNKLKPYICENPKQEATITYSDLYKYGLIGKDGDLRLYVCEKLNLGKCSGKTLYKRLISNNINISTLEKVIEEYNK